MCSYFVFLILETFAKKKKKQEEKSWNMESLLYRNQPIDQWTGFGMRGDLHHNATYTEDLSKHMKDET